MAIGELITRLRTSEPQVMEIYVPNTIVLDIDTLNKNLRNCEVPIGHEQFWQGILQTLQGKMRGIL